MFTVGGSTGVILGNAAVDLALHDTYYVVAQIFNEISMTWGVDDGDFVDVGLEFPESDIDGDTSFSFSLQLVQNPSVFKRTFSHFGGFFLEFFDGSLVDTTTFVDQMTGGGGFTGIDVTDDNDVDMSFCFSHFSVSST